MKTTLPHERAHDGLRDRDLESLRSPAAYPDDPSAAAGVHEAQTHISWVFLTGARVYKFRKPVSLGFVDFASRTARNADCDREVALNRRLAPDVYLGVAPLCAREDVHVGALAGHVQGNQEHCVVMRRLAHGRDALSLLQVGSLTAEQVASTAKTIAAFHARVGLGSPAPWTAEQWNTRIARPVLDNFRALAGDATFDARAVARARRAAEEAFVARADAFERRRVDGRAVDGHGDLHLAHVWFETDDSAPLAIDCLEFNEELRRIDAASDVAFFAMDLVYRDAERLAERFLAEYADAGLDHDSYAVVDYYVAYRAAVRAKVAALAARDEGVDAAQRERAAESARRHLALAAGALERRPQRALVVLCGVVGTGKTTVARTMAAELCAPCVSSDRVREHVLAGVARTSRYGDAHKRAVYDALFERARTILSSGRTAVLDATFESRELRARALQLGRETEAQVWLIEARADRALVLDRLAARRRAGRSASDAGPEHYEGSVARFEPAAHWPADRHVVLRTDRDRWREEVAAAVRRIVEQRDRAAS